MGYGLPYQGCKQKIAQRIIDTLPSADNLYDVFCGGGSISHAALLSGKWKHVHFSDIDDVVLLFRDCLEGNIPDGSEWISREEFERRKSTDAFVRVFWSFSNNCKDYIYGRDIEPYKKAVHEMIFASTPTERRLKFKEVCRLIPFFLVGGYKENQQPRDNGTLADTASRLQHMERLYPPPRPTSPHRPSIVRKLPEAAYRCEPLERTWGG